MLRRTLVSIHAAGFPPPRLFVDGGEPEEHFKWMALNQLPQKLLEITHRFPLIEPFGNFFLGLSELWVRDPHADWYAMFQDDFVACRNLRTYLEAVPPPLKTYGNLYTFPENQRCCDVEGGRKIGWHESNQFGLGAVALIFPREAVPLLLSWPTMIAKPADARPARATKSVDGGILTAMSLAGWKEMIHNPSLVQHVGSESTIGNPPFSKALSFRGEGFDALELLRENPQALTGGFAARRFVGRWQLWNGTGVSSILTVGPDLTAVRRHVPEYPCKAETVGDAELRFSWPDGHRDAMRIAHSGEVHFHGYGREAGGWDGVPRITLRAIKLP